MCIYCYIRQIDLSKLIDLDLNELIDLVLQKREEGETQMKLRWTEH